MEKEHVNHPKHYNQYPTEVIDMMIAIWGREKVKTFCEINAFKYRMRVGLKENTEEDLKKEQWYLKKAKELEEDTIENKKYDLEKILIAYSNFITYPKWESIKYGGVRGVVRSFLKEIS